MSITKEGGIYQELGVRRVINAVGNATVLGGSRLGPKIQTAMEEADEYFVEMEELLEKSGKAVADLLGCEAALITSGCYAAQVLGTAGIISGSDPEKIRRLPNATGMKSEFLVQAPTRWGYDRCVSVAGGTLVEVGDRDGVTSEQMEAAIGPNTVGILYLARAEGTEGVLSIPAVIDIAKRKGIQVLIDSAAEIYPLERMTWLPSSGALVCFGAKYIGSANSTGILAGPKELVEAATLHNFVAFQTRGASGIGRGFKVDRQEVIAVIVALREWFTMNHEERFAVQERRIQTIVQGLAGIPHVNAESVWNGKSPWMAALVTIDEAALGKGASSVVQALKDGNPSIMAATTSRTATAAVANEIRMHVHQLREGEDKIIADRLREVLTSS